MSPHHSLEGMSLATLALHGDDDLAQTSDVAPPVHVSTTYRYPSDPQLLDPSSFNTTFADPTTPHAYSRLTTQSTSRLEQTLSNLLHGHVATFSSGLSAFHGILVRVNPKRLLVSEGYHGVHGVAKLMSRLTGMEVLPLDTQPVLPGDLLHLETPINPRGEAISIQVYADRAHAAGALLCVDSTLAPPPLQDPFKHGADWVMHSGTKYIGGHSDILAGVVATKSLEEAVQLKTERLYTGAVMGSLEGWLGLRSVRTLELRVRRQSESAEAIVAWLSTSKSSKSSIISKAVAKVFHASLQQKDDWLLQQMPEGYGPLFAVNAVSEEVAKRLPSKLALWQHATSLGGVESLIEWRTMTDSTADRSLLRFSVGLEGAEDLEKDLERGFTEVMEELEEEKQNGHSNGTDGIKGVNGVNGA